jgi:Holliday junction resolvase
MEVRGEKIGWEILTNSFETKIASIFKNKGYYTIISAGSRGIADIVALKPSEILFIQCKKSGGLSLNERQRLRQITSSLNAIGVLATHRKGRILIKEVQ